MSFSKDLFLKDKALAKYWVSIARDDRFARIVTFARGAVMEALPRQEQLQGAEMVIDVLLHIADNPEDAPPFPSPGLIHNIDSKPEKPKPS